MPGHLIHIGFPKTGSTFLQDWFAQHPSLLYAPGGLGGFYSVYQISQRCSCEVLERYLYFVTSSEALSTPTFSSGTIPIEQACEDLSQRQLSVDPRTRVAKVLSGLYPNAKILLVTRGFEDLMMSSYSQYLKEGGVLDIGRFFAPRQGEVWSEEQEGWPLMNYDVLASLYEENFGRDNVFLLPYEMLRDGQAAFLEAIEQWLGIPPHQAQVPRVNESLTPTELYWYSRVSMRVSRLTKRLGRRMHPALYRWYVSKTLKGQLAPLVRVFSKLKPGREVRKTDLPPAMMEYFRQNCAERYAGRFRRYPVYQPYLKDYLLSDQEHGRDPR